VGEIFRAVSAGQPIGDHSILTGWRGEAAGQAMIELLKGKLRMQLEWDQMLRTSRSSSGS